MPLPCIPCSSSFPAEHPSPILTAGDPTRLATSSSETSITSSSSSAAASSASAYDTVSIQTFPSLPTLHSFYSSQNAPSPPVSASFSLLSSLNTPQHPSQSAPSLTLASNLLYSFSQSSIAVYDITDLRQVLSVSSLPSAGAVKSVTGAGGGGLFTAHQDGKIRAWSKGTPAVRLIASLPTTSDRLRRFAVPSNYVTVRRHRKRLWIEHADAVSAVAAAGGLLYSVSWDKTLKIWRLSDLRCVESVAAHDDAVNSVAVGPDGTVYTGSADRKIKVWARGSGGRRHELVATLERHKSAVNALAVSGDGAVLYSGACDRSILVWEREESANFMICSGALRGHVRAIMCLSTVGIELLVSGSTDRTVRIWRRGGIGEGYGCLCVLEGHMSGVRSLVAERDEEGYRVCSASVDGEVRVWRVRVESVKGSESDKN